MIEKRKAYEMAVQALQGFRQIRSEHIQELTRSGTNRALRKQADRELTEIDQAIAILREDMAGLGF